MTMPLDEADPFHAIAHLLGHDPRRVRRVVAAFYRSTMADLVALEHAAALGEWAQVRALARRLSLGCVQVHAHAEARVFEPLCEVHGDVAARAIFLGVFGRHRGRVIALLTCAANRAFAEDDD